MRGYSSVLPPPATTTARNSTPPARHSESERAFDTTLEREILPILQLGLTAPVARRK